MKRNIVFLGFVLGFSNAFAAQTGACVQQCEKITEEHFMEHYSKVCKTNPKEINKRIKDAKIKEIKQKHGDPDNKTHNMSEKEKKEVSNMIKGVTANCNDKSDLLLISKVSPFNNESDFEKGQRVPFSSPFEYGLQCVKQCRDKGVVEEGVPVIWKKEIK